MARLHVVLAGQLLRRIGLHPPQELVMMRLWDRGPQRQADLARSLNADPATMTRTIQRLERGGFVRRTPSTTDKRVTVVEATTASRSLRDEVEWAWSELERAVTRDLTPAEQSAALDLLGRMGASLSQILSDRCGPARPLAASHTKIGDAMASEHNQWNQRIIEEFRGNSGTVSQFGRNLVLLHHIGAKSGQERVTPVMSVRQDPGTWLIAASKAGAPDNPAWYHNLLAHPDVTIETADDGTVPVRAEDLAGPARDSAWERFTAVAPGFREYQQQTTRVIPVLALHHAH